MAKTKQDSKLTAIQIRVPQYRLAQIQKLCEPTGARPAGFTLAALYKVLDSFFMTNPSQRKGTKR